MEIDLIAGLIKPKIALSELPTLEGPNLPEGTLADFTALLNGTIPDESSTPEAMRPSEVTVNLAVSLPQELLPKVSPEPVTTVSVGPDVKTVPEKALDPKIIAAARAPRPTTMASVTNRIAMPEQTAKGTEIVRVPLAHPERQATSVTQQKHEFSADLPATVTNKILPESKAPVAGFSPLPVERPVEEQRIRMPDKPLSDIPTLPLKFTPKGAGQTPALPAPALGFANIDTVVDTPDEVQFGIRIERQSLEGAPSPRAAPQAAPLASQITVQLPQMLSKAEKQTVELRLDPPELGRVTIHLSTLDQQVSATVIAERVDTVDLMRRHAELLAATLARAGFSQADLSFQQGQGQNGESKLEQLQSIPNYLQVMNQVYPLQPSQAKMAALISASNVKDV